MNFNLSRNVETLVFTPMPISQVTILKCKISINMFGTICLNKYLLIDGHNIIYSNLWQVTKLYYDLKLVGELPLIIMTIENINMLDEN